MPTTTTAREHLSRATMRALEYYDAGDKKNAFASFLSDVTKHDDTAWIASHPATFMLLETGYAGGRDRFKYMMEGFAASDQLPEPTEGEAHRAPANMASEEGLMQAHFGVLAGGDILSTIKTQEKAGQTSFTSSDTLPREMSTEAMIALRTAGVEFGGLVTGDDLFVYAKLPEGWKRQGTSHDMHSDLLDEKGRKRAGIFYKAAFYDRRANLSIVTRFSIRPNYDAPEGRSPRHGL
jgi:hypothetical protein